MISRCHTPFCFVNKNSITVGVYSAIITATPEVYACGVFEASPIQLVEIAISCAIYRYFAQYRYFCAEFIFSIMCYQCVTNVLPLGLFIYICKMNRL